MAAPEDERLVKACAGKKIEGDKPGLPSAAAELGTCAACRPTNATCGVVSVGKDVDDGRVDGPDDDDDDDDKEEKAPFGMGGGLVVSILAVGVKRSLACSEPISTGAGLDAKAATCKCKVSHKVTKPSADPATSTSSGRDDGDGICSGLCLAVGAVAGGEPNSGEPPSSTSTSAAAAGGGGGGGGCIAAAGGVQRAALAAAPQLCARGRQASSDGGASSSNDKTAAAVLSLAGVGVCACSPVPNRCVAL
mmetsp:Transcript_74602/g.145831  ORF Transcript_74602/g.145831 Transcript_74602/m.145831 type:complete len:249 (-) Transcript_74602:255-1001(-)